MIMMWQIWEFFEYRPLRETDRYRSPRYKSCLNRGSAEVDFFRVTYLTHNRVAHPNSLTPLPPLVRHSTQPDDKNLAPINLLTCKIG